jgi:hypothetical protein
MKTAAELTQRRFKMKSDATKEFAGSGVYQPHELQRGATGA